jgi:adenylate cyclase
MSGTGQPFDALAVVARAEEFLLGGPLRYNRRQVCELAGVPLEEARVVWRALGFATTADEDVVFTDADVSALKSVKVLVGTGAVDAGDVAAIARLMGQSFYRLASTQGQFLLRRVLENPEALASEENALDLLQQLAPAVAELQDYVWRRQSAAFLERVVTRAAADDETAGQRMAVGFADMEGFTSRTRRSTEQELRHLLEEFERLTTDVVVQHGGHIVKAIGDEVLFVADEPLDAALIALDLRDAAATSEVVPDLRIGLAVGPVVVRMGDVFGSTVNIASRLTSLGRPGWILVDRGMADALDGDARFALRSRRPESVRGFHHLRQWRLQRPDEARRSRRHR